MRTLKHEGHNVHKGMETIFLRDSLCLIAF